MSQARTQGPSRAPRMPSPHSGHDGSLGHAAAPGRARLARGASGCCDELLEATAVAVDWTQRGRERWLQQEGAAVQAASNWRGMAFDVPAYVMNLARRPDRREHSAALLRALGFSRVVFPETIAAAELDVQGALAQGWLTPESLRGFDDRVHLRRDSAKRAYIANTIGHLSALRQGVGSGSEVFLVLEDDLLPAAPLLKVRERLQDMLDEIGSAQHGADML